MHFLHVFVCLTSFAFALVAAQTICTPQAVSPAFTTSVDFEAVELETHALVATPNSPPWSVHAVEWATGLRQNVASSVSYFLPAANSRTWGYVDNNGTAVVCFDALCTQKRQINPVGTVAAATTMGLSFNLAFTPDSSKALFVDRTTNLSGLWVVSLDETQTAIRLSDPSHAFISSFIMSGDSRWVCYTNGTVTISATWLYCVSIFGGAVASFGIPGIGGVQEGSITFSRDSTYLAYRAAISDAKLRVFVAPVNGSFADAVEVSPELIAGSRGATTNLDWMADSAYVVFLAQYAQYGIAQRWFACPRNATNSSFAYPISGPTAGVSFPYAVAGTQTSFVYLASQPNASAQVAVWQVDAKNNGDLVPGLQLSIDGPGAVVTLTDRLGTYLAYTGDLNTKGVTELFVVPIGGPANASVKLSPAGQVDLVIPIIGTTKLTFRAQAKTAYVADLATLQLGVAVSRPQDSVLFLSPAPNGISALYSTTKQSELFVTCLVSPTLVGPNQTVALNTTKIDGHLVLQSNSSAIEFPAPTVITIAGSAVLNGGTLLVGSCASGTFALNATLVVGTFGSIASNACNCQTYSSDVVYTSTSVLITFVVDHSSPTCAPLAVAPNGPNGSTTTASGSGVSTLSTGAIVGICVGVGAVAVGVAVGVAVVAVHRKRTKKVTRDMNRDINARNSVHLRKLRENNDVTD